MADDKFIVPKYSRITSHVTRNGSLVVGHFTFDRSKGLVAVHGNPTEKDALAVADWLVAVQESAQVSLGTLLVWIEQQGERKWGKTVEQVCAQSGVATQTIYNAYSVMRRIPEENRLPGLTFSDYASVATLQPEKQRAWLEKKIDKGWTARELNARIHPEHDQYHEVTCIACGAKLLVDRPVTVLGLKGDNGQVIDNESNKGGTNAKE
jgi:hypothetical protein